MTRWSAPRVSVLVPVHDRYAFVRRTLLTLEHQTLDRGSFEVILIDNDSTDDVGSLVTEFESRIGIRRIVVPKRHRFESCRVRNAGIDASVGEVIVFLDSDMVVPSQFLENHLLFHDFSENVAVLGKMVYLDSNDWLTDEALASPLTPDAVGPHQLVGNTVHRFLAMSGNLGQYDRPWQLCVAANLSVGRNVIGRAGGFDEHLDGDLPAGGDVAYAMKLHAHGARLVYGRFAVGFHQHNHALRVHEDVGYFDARQRSVRRHEAQTYERYGQRDAYERLLSKRRLTDAMHRSGLQFTQATIRRLAPRDRRAAAMRDGDPTLSVLLVYDQTPNALASVLRALADCDVPELFEVLVLDPTVSPDDDACEAGSAAEVIVQTADVPYALRYYPTGTDRYRRLQRTRAATAEDRRVSSMEHREYSTAIETLMSERPRGIAAKLVRMSECTDPAGQLRHWCRAAQGVAVM